uniref:Fibrinogen C-terminal domain-containing protein n=1 Tax=Anopheles merus TaxID=30066 RepID=A0A182VJP6_ANOME
MKQDREIVEQKLAGVTRSIILLEKTLDQSLTNVKTQLNQMLTEQTVHAKRKKMKQEIQKLVSKNDLAGFRVSSGLYLQSISSRPCKEEPSKESGRYILQPTEKDEPFLGYCEQTAFRGGWLVLQYRYDGSVDFYRNWTKYRNGFGSVDGEFWLGLEQLHRLTAARKHELLVELKDYDGNYMYARYEEFKVGSEKDQYPLAKLGAYTGTAGDSLHGHKGMKFSTKDRDNDNSPNSISFPSCKKNPSKRSGKYIIQPTEDDEPFLGYCEQTAFGGGWLVFQFRYDGSVNFYRNWTEYRNGFGSIDGEFWLGLEHLHRITSARKHELLVELIDYDGNYKYARYNEFMIGSEKEQFALAKLGLYTGTADDAMKDNKDEKFTTMDRDNDAKFEENCASTRQGAWWYYRCSDSNLNGVYACLFA